MNTQDRQESSGEDEDTNAREQFVRDFVSSSMTLRDLVKEFLARFHMKNRSSAFDSLKKTLIQGGYSDMADELRSTEFQSWWKANHVRLIGVSNLLKKETAKVQVGAIMDGSRLLQVRMSDMANPYLLSGVSESEGSGAESPCVSYQRRKSMRVHSQEASSSLGPKSEDVDSKYHFAKLGQAVKWNIRGTDMVANFMSFKEKDSTNLYSLSLDDIADVRSGSNFAKTLDDNVGRCARMMEPAPDIFKKWPTLVAICQRVFPWEDYDKVFEAVCKERMDDPIARYLMAIVMAYSHYFQFREDIPQDVNEHEGFGLTSTFIRTAQTMYNIESRYQEVLITGVVERKNRNKDPRIDSKEPGRFADGVALDTDHQIMISEASLLQHAKSEKRLDDEHKLFRSMRDSWVSQVGSICAQHKPPQGIAVYGSASFTDESRLFCMDYQGAFRLRQFDAFFIPLRKKDFGSKMKESVLSCLQVQL